MKVLLVYGTTEGQTEKVIQFIAGRLERQRHQVTMVRAGGAQPIPDLSQFDAVIVAASVHAGRYQRAVIHFVKRHLAAIEARANALVSVSLAAASHAPGDLAGLKKCVSAFRRATGWKPNQVQHVAGAFRYTKYNALTRWVMRRIAYRNGVSTDTGRDRELTDWADVARFADTFLVRRTLPTDASELLLSSGGRPAAALAVERQAG